jgi:hypothetical protein
LRLSNGPADIQAKNILFGIEDEVEERRGDEKIWWGLLHLHGV